MARTQLIAGRRPAPADAREFPSARAAVEAAAAARPVAITVDGRHIVVPKSEADRLAATGVAFAYLTEYDGRVVSVPVNG
jgi:hypothetical protein